MKKIFHFSSKSVSILVICIIIAVILYVWLFSPAKADQVVFNQEALSGQSAAVSGDALREKYKQVKDEDAKKALKEKAKKIKEKQSTMPNVVVDKETKDTVRRVTTAAALGAGLGSVVPIVGTTVGGLIGAGTGFLTTFVIPFHDELLNINLPTEEIVDVITNPAVMPFYDVSGKLIDTAVNRIEGEVKDATQSVVDPIGYTEDKIDDTVEIFDDVWDTTEDLFNW